ncbi:SET domain containing protein, putative [Angomonas deanei]|uniref:SET domain containing protein, putative n=1 Tax=Angomonas deanei TaxID=59799 RepID=A0A7G2CNI1_9TRYP|nr:SET domain containing protein, putative [Angomonas deanei]
MTCMMKLNRRADCIEMAQRALRVNPIFGKANAMWGRCLVEDATLLEKDGPSIPEAFRLLCRAMYQVPALGESLHTTLVTALDAMLAEHKTNESSVAGTNLEEALRIQTFEGNGKGVYANQPLPAFTQVSSTLNPFSVSVYEETEGKMCCLCCAKSLLSQQGEEEIKVVRCITCGIAHYCSQACYERYNSARHEKYECRYIQMLWKMSESGKTFPEEFFETALHCITTFSGIHSGWKGHQEVLQLASHGEEVAQRLHPIAPLISELLPHEPRPLVIQVLGVIRCNALEMSDFTGLGVGQALFAGEDCITSFFNHSCDPNCAIDPSESSIRTIRPTRAGEELTISYLPQLYWPALKRQEKLSERYYFSCRCPRCEQRETDPFEKAISYLLPKARENATVFYHKKVQQLCGEVRSRHIGELGPSDLKQVEALLAECEQHLFPFHYLCHDVRNTLTFLYSVLQMPEKCLDSCLQELLMWESIICGALPVKLMKLQNILCCQPQENKSTAALAPYVNRLALLYGVAEEADPSA